MGAPGHGREKWAHVHSFGDKADASDSHQSPLLNCCLNPRDVSVQEACGARPCGRHRLQLQSRPPRLAFRGPGFIAPLVGRTRRLPALAGCGGGLVAVREIVGPRNSPVNGTSATMPTGISELMGG